MAGVGFAMSGKRDIPRAAHWVGRQVGRLVGLVQGAQARADQFASKNEMSVMQNQFRSGLRDLDAVRAEVTSTLMRPVMGRQLGSTVPSGANQHSRPVTRLGPANPPLTTTTTSTASALAAGATSSLMDSAAVSSSSSSSFLDDSSSSSSTAAPHSSSSLEHLMAPTQHTIGAITEEEWARQGMDFKSRAEQGIGLQQQLQQQAYDPSTCSSVLLSNLLQQSLVYDQYDRVQHQHNQVLRPQPPQQPQQQQPQHPESTQSPTRNEPPNQTK